MSPSYDQWALFMRLRAAIMAEISDHYEPEPEPSGEEIDPIRAELTDEGFGSEDILAFENIVWRINL